MVSMFLSSLPLLIFVASSAVVTTAQPTQANNISLGSSLTVNTPADSWPSSSGRFAFGFYPKGQGFAIGVWLATAPDRTVVWTANRDDPPITEGSIRLTYDGRLLWSATAGQEKAISQAGQAVALAAMLDSGNFVLYNARQQIIWSTFASPTDTLLPGQTLPPLAQLFSSASKTDRSTGRFRLNNQQDGNLVLYPVGSTDTADDAYWDVGTFQIGFLLTLNLGNNGVLYLTGNGGNYVKNLTASLSPPNGLETYYQAIVDVDGILRLYSHSFTKKGSSSNTTVEWAALKDGCHVRGVCGLNSYCDSTANGSTTCRCPPGYKFLDPGQVLLGCMNNSTGGGCNAGGDTPAATMATMGNTTWLNKPYFVPSLSTTTTTTTTATLDDCKAACLADCFCEAALLSDGVCSKQTLPLKYGRTGGNDTVLVKVVAVNPGNKTTVVYQKNKKLSFIALVTSAVLAAVSIVGLAISCFLIMGRQLRLGGNYRKTSPQESFDDGTPMRAYSYDELERATEGFTEELGRGAFGTVFKGALADGEKIIAVKRLEKMVEDGEREFQREVRAIGRTHHRNLVRLLGFCNEGTNRLLVYEYMSNGSLASFLFKSEASPTWAERVRIALDVARGLQYLHEEIEAHIIHCDIKPQNILMDESRTAKISDFGLAKLLMPDQTRTFTGIRGTRGYLAPEWHKNAPITVKADVYSFGIVLLEIICCRRSMELKEAGQEYGLSEWVYECFEAGELGRILDDETVEKAELERVLKVGLWCVQNEPVSRPSMKNVILMLEGSMKASLPPPPASISF